MSFYKYRRGSGSGKTFVSEFNGRDVISYDIDPKELGIQRYSIADIRGGELTPNVKIINQVLDGMAGAHRDIVILNAAYALYTAEKVDTISKGVRLAEKSIDSGQASEKLEQLKEYTNHVR